MVSEPIALTVMRTPRFFGIFTPASGAPAYQYVFASLNFALSGLARRRALADWSRRAV